MAHMALLLLVLPEGDTHAAEAAPARNARRRVRERIRRLRRADERIHDAEKGRRPLPEAVRAPPVDGMARRHVLRPRVLPSDEPARHAAAAVKDRHRQAAPPRHFSKADFSGRRSSNAFATALKQQALPSASSVSHRQI